MLRLSTTGTEFSTFKLTQYTIRSAIKCQTSQNFSAHQMFSNRLHVLSKRQIELLLRGAYFQFMILTVTRKIVSMRSLNIPEFYVFTSYLMYSHHFLKQSLKFLFRLERLLVSMGGTKQILMVGNKLAL